MTDKDTKEIPIVQERPAPDTPQEGDDMPITLESLHLRISVVEVEIQSLKQRLLSPEQITDMIKTAIDGSVRRVETLVEAISKTVGDNVFDSARIDSIDAKLTTRARDAAESERKIDAVVGWISIMAARDVTDPDSKAIAEPYFDAVKRLATEANALSLSIAREFSESRTDYNEGRRELKDGITTVTAIYEDLKPLAAATAQNAQRWKAVQDALETVLRNPKLLLPTAALFGGGVIVTPEVLKAIWNVIVSAISQGAN